MQPLFIDLHTHTTASDGSDSPADLVRKAAEARLAAIAITDHDTISGVEEAQEAGRALGVEVIPGCELSVSSEYGEVHILGLWLPHRSDTLKARLAELRQRRDERNEHILERLAALGMPLTMEEVKAFSSGEALGRPHIARAMAARGYAPDLQTAMSQYLATGKPAYVPKAPFTPEEGVALLLEFGATVSLAHIMLLRCPEDWRADLVARLARCGMDAIEAYHSEFSARDERTCIGFANQHGLAITGGSDYHGTSKPHIRIGRGKGGLRVTCAILDRLKAHRRSLGLPV